jgi:hypothetical protein
MSESRYGVSYWERKMGVPWYRTFFGEPWPSGVCEDGVQVPTPVGKPCAFCDEAIGGDDRGSFIGAEDGPAPMHRECSLRSVRGGIGHLTDHAYWCGQKHDPDGGLSRRESALRVWNWVIDYGLSVEDRPTLPPSSSSPDVS